MSLSMRDIDLIEQLIHIECNESFFAYRKFLHPSLKTGWFVESISQDFQDFYDDLVAGKRPSLAVSTPPQHGKSSAVVDFVSWVAGKNPNLRVIFASFSSRLGERANLQLQRIYDSKRYKRLFPETTISTVGTPNTFGATRNRELLEYIHKDGYFRNTTTGGAVTGESADLVIVDDPVKSRQDANSSMIMERTEDWFHDDLMTRCSENSGVLIVNTRWSVQDLVGRLTAKDNHGIKTVNYEAIATQDEAHRNAGEALFPEHKSIEFLKAAKASMAVSSFESLFQGAPFVAEGEFYKPDMIGTIEAVPVGTTSVRAWDFAATKDGGDWTVGFKMGKMPDGRAIIMDIARAQVGPEEVRVMLKNSADRDGRDTRVRIPQDPGQAGKDQSKSMVTQLSGFTVVAKTVSGEKTIRAEPFASQVNVGNVVMLKASWNDELIEELRSFPNGVHDDQSDAGADAYNELFGGGTGADSLFDYMKELHEAARSCAGNKQ